MAEPIETAGDLYKEIKRRGLQLRKENGRDNGLLAELCAEIGCPDSRLAGFLAQSDKSAADLLEAFLKIAAPFAMMFRDIWKFLASNTAPDAREKIRVRFGFDRVDQVELDIDQFREMVRTSEYAITRTSVDLWSYDALHALFGIIELLGVKYEEGAQPTQRYRPEQPYQMRDVPEPSDDFEQIVNRVRQVFQEVANRAADSYKTRDRRLPEMIEPAEPAAQELRRSSVLLTDLLPTWNVVFQRYIDFDPRAKKRAVEYFRHKVEPLLKHRSEERRVELLALLDILQLPFWKHRWQTYEIWSSVTILDALRDYRPRLTVSEGSSVLDTSTAGVVARFDVQNQPDACAVVQLQTPFFKGRRTAVKPDFSICYDSKMNAESRAVVIEFKQRAELSRIHVEEVGTSYLEGSPNAASVIIINYDVSGVKVALPDRVVLLEGIRPNSLASVAAFQDMVRKLAGTCGMAPPKGAVIALLDVSSSMGNAYTHPAAQAGLRQLLDISWVKVLRFNTGLLPGGDLSKSDLQNGLSTEGGTDLALTLAEIERIVGLPDKLLIVTDGGYGEKPALLSQISTVLECMPENLPSAIKWVLGG